MTRALLISVRLHDARYHGMGEDLPSPARLFQALVAGAGLSGPLDHGESKGLKWREALEWLEQRDHPIIGLTRAVLGQAFQCYVPSNDLDAVGGSARRIAKTRGQKNIRPLLLEEDTPWLFAWLFDDGENENHHAQSICALSERLYQFGRGVDMAWAWGEVLDNDELERRFSNHPGRVYSPSMGGNGPTLACPVAGSLKSLTDRFEAGSRRFRNVRDAKAGRRVFSQPPKPRFAQVAYDSPPSRRVYEVRRFSSEAPLVPCPLSHASRLVVRVRDAAVERLRAALPDRISEIERVLVGRKPDGTDEGPTSSRVRIVPLPSIGHQHTDRAIRRLVVEVPSGCSIRADDVHWAFSGLELLDQETGEVAGLIHSPSNDESMLAHYGMATMGFRTWRTVTPAALPEWAGRRRIDRAHVTAEVKPGAERAAEHARAAWAVVQALRYAGVRTDAETIRLQREPFEGNGERVEAFDPETRFPKERLWHVEITFGAPVVGPLVIGDGRFLGLGLMAPLRAPNGVFAFLIEEGLAATAQPVQVTRALRRGVMARVQQVIGSDRKLPSFFSGHQHDGSPAQTENSPHLTFVFDPGQSRLLIVAPHIVDRRDPTREEIQNLQQLEESVADFRELRAGSAGRLILRECSIDRESDPLFAASRTWESVTPYQVTRHAKRIAATEALSSDLRIECRRRGLPDAHVTPRDVYGVSGVGLIGAASMTFEVAVEGPILLGRSRHLGGGLFAGKTPLLRSAARHGLPVTDTSRR